MALRDKVEDMIQKAFAYQMTKFLQKTGTSLTDAKVPVIGSAANGNPLFNQSSIGSADLAKLSGANALSGSIADEISGLISREHPIGSIYMSTVDIDPSTLFGGTWERLEGRFLLGADSTYTAGSTGGEASHTLTVDEMPQHSHSLPSGTVFVRDGSYYNVLSYGGLGVSTNKAGGSQPHNNMPPYLAVYMWKRTA